MPGPHWDSPEVTAIARELDAPGTRALVRAAQGEARYPEEVLDRLGRAGLWRLLAGEADDPGSTSPVHLCALNAATARVDGSLAITVGVNSLALLGVTLGGTAEQQATLLDRVRQGHSAACALSEWKHGSDLLSGETRAVAVAGGYRVTGSKELINGGSQAQLLVTLVRTRDADDASPLGRAADFSLLAIPRSEAVRATRRHDTLPCRGADISDVAFDAVFVPASLRLGAEGEGFALVQRVLTMSRGGIAALASGAASQASVLAWRHARGRTLYGAPITELGAIEDHLVRLCTLDHLAAAVSVKATSAMNALGQASGHVTAAAKLAACDLAQEAVTEGRRVLGSRALLEDNEYAALVRDVLLYEVFDGTRHVMAEHVARGLTRLSRAHTTPETWLDRWRAAYALPAQPASQASKRARPLIESLAARARFWSTGGSDELGALAHVAADIEAAVAVTRGTVWDGRQELRVELAGAAAELEAILALVELTIGRERLLLRGRASEAQRATCSHAIGWRGARLAHVVARILHRAGQAPATDVRDMMILARGEDDARQRLAGTWRTDSV